MRFNSIYHLSFLFIDVFMCLTKICLNWKNSMQRTEAFKRWESTNLFPIRLPFCFADLKYAGSCFTNRLKKNIPPRREFFQPDVNLYFFGLNLPFLNSFTFLKIHINSMDDFWEAGKVTMPKRHDLS